MHEVKPDAHLVGEGDYEDNILRIYSGYRRCYSGLEGETDTPESIEAAENFIRRMLKAEHAHESPLEHASLTWHITCSRACSHQLVRHRIASYSQQSQRYVKMDDLPYVMPPKLAADQNARVTFVNTMAVVESAYRHMVSVCEAGAEDARFILPNTVATQIVVTMNFRTLLHFFAERTCNRAQWEIRNIANQMLEVCKELYPAIFENAGPHCIKLKHCPEAKPCGQQPRKKE